LHGREYSEADLNHRNGVWFSFDHYTRFSSASKDDCLLKINAVSRKANEFIKKCKNYCNNLWYSSGLQACAYRTGCC
jgi:hypothetical protein